MIQNYKIDELLKNQTFCLSSQTHKIIMIVSATSESTSTVIAF